MTGLKKIEHIYLCNSSGKLLGLLNGIDEDTCSLKINLLGVQELSFEVQEFINIDGVLVKTNLYDEIGMLMNLFIPDIGFFIIDSSSISINDTERKTISASSCEKELEHKNTTFKINCGTTDSLEYIVTYDDGETESLINEYTGLPYDYITVKNTYDTVLKNVLNRYKRGYYNQYGQSEWVYSNKIQEIVDLCNMIPRVKNKVITHQNNSTSIEEYVIFTYDQDGKNVTAIQLVNGLFENRLNTLIKFYEKYKTQLSIMDYITYKTNNIWSIGHVDKKFINKKVRFEIENTSIYNFITQELANSLECIPVFDSLNKTISLYSVENIGMDTGINLSYDTVQNSLDIQCDENSIFTRFKVSGGDGLSIKQVNFGTDIIEDLSYFMDYRDSNGQRLFVTDELYNKYQSYIKWKDDNREQFKNYSINRNSILKDINDLICRVPNDGLKVDWDTYTSTELEEQLSTYKKLLNTLITLYKNDYGSNGCNPDGSVNENFIKNTIYWYDYCAYKHVIQQIETTANNGLSDEEKVKLIDAYKTEWTLYGTKELENIITSYEDKLSIFKEEGSLIFGVNGNILYWDDLSDLQKKEYNNDLSGTYNMRCDEYMSKYNEMISAKSYLDSLKSQLDSLNNQLSSLDSSYKSLNINSDIRNFSINGQKVFTDDELKILNSLYIDTDYSNENIITTSSDSIVSKINHSTDLLNDAIEKLSISAQPQYTFSVGIDNILHIQGFESLLNDFNVGNYIYIEYKTGLFLKMRLVSYAYNPLIVDNELSVEFSNMIKSATSYNDYSYLLGNINGSSKSSSSSSGGTGGSSSDFGDELDVTMTDTMLAKLLNTELFGTRVTNVILDTIDVNRLNAKYATFGGLSGGTTIIDGACLQTGTILSNAILNNQPYTIINLDDGSFSFAGGKLYYSPTTNELVMQGTISSSVIEAPTINGGSIKIGDNFYVDSSGNIIATAGKIGGFNITDCRIYTNECGMNLNGVGAAFWAGSGDYTGNSAEFKVYHDGHFYARKGTISCFNLTENSFYSGNIESIPDSIDSIHFDKNRLAIKGQTTSDYIFFISTRQNAAHMKNVYLSGTIFMAIGNAWEAYKDGATAYLFYLDKDIGRLYFAYDEKFTSVMMKTCIENFGNQRTIGGVVYPRVSLEAAGEIWCSSNIRVNGNIYNASGSVIVTSDRDMKHDILSFDERYEAFFMDIEPCTFVYNGRTRKHSGAVAQQIEQAMHNNGLENNDFAGLVIEDNWLLNNEDGTYTTKEKMYALRYEEFVMLNIHMTQKLHKKVDELESKVSEQRKEIDELKTIVNKLLERLN